MAKTALERKREQLDRDREAFRVMPDSSYPFLAIPFYEWLNQNRHGDWSIFEQEILGAGFPIPEFDDDRGAQSLDGVLEQSKADNGYDPYAGYEGSVGRAESVIDFMLSSTRLLASIVRDYKLDQIHKRIREIEEADLSDPKTKKAALSDMVKLTKIREQLQKEIRYQLPAYKVKGI